MKFNKDIFISYAHLDNNPLPPSEIGWISRFHESLEAFVSMRMGEKVRIWRDSKLRGDDIFSDEIVGQFRNTAILVSILTPRYIKSEWCPREMREFCEAAEKSGGVIVGHKSRVIKVIKTPIDRDNVLPDITRQVLGYEFFKYEDGDTPLELDPAYGTEFAEAYNRKIATLAYDLKELLERLRDRDEVEGPTPEQTDRDRPAIFLAECSYDLEDENEKMRIEFKTAGYRVLPEQPLLKSEARQVAEVERLLAECRLSVHLIGRSYGSVPDGPSQKSNVILQNGLGAAASRSRGLARIIWLPEGMRSDNPKQQAFIEALHRDANLQFGADLITASFEHLKAEIHRRLQQLQHPERPRVEVADAGSSGEKFIYLICTREDRSDTLPLRKALMKEGFSVEIPALEGDAAALRKVNERQLSQCDVVIVYYGAGDEAWKRSVDSDLKKLPSYRSGKPLRASFIYLAPPKTSDKEELVALESSNLFDASEGASDRPVAEFVETISSNLGLA